MGINRAIKQWMSPKTPYSNRVPLDRKAKSEEISSSIIYFASDASSYVTVHNLVIDGGWTIW